jgi:hypothetical protein
MPLKDLLDYLEANGLVEHAWTAQDFTESGGRFHTKAACRETRKAGGPKNCVIHKPSTHKMIGWPMVVRASTLIERTCKHGVGHPDPDSVAYLNWKDEYDDLYGWGVHGCDGCCLPAGANRPNEDNYYEDSEY